MRRADRRVQVLVLLVGSVLLAPPAQGGAFIFAEDFADAITHPQVYAGTGGERPELTVCLDRSINSSLTQRAEISVQQAIATWNRGRSLASHNYALNSATDIRSGYDFESVLLHELGHCQGLNHVNQASESGFNDPQANGTKSGVGADGVFTQNAGSDGLHGSRDDLRGDDVNLHWYIRGVNNPGLLPAVADSTTLARTLEALPSGHRFAANADRSVMAALGFANAEAVMQQGTFAREAKRHLQHDDLLSLRFARSGLDRRQGTADDYRYRLRYVGRLSNPSNAACNVRIRIDNSTGFAVCGVNAEAIGNNTTQWRITTAQIAMNAQVDWHYSEGANTRVQLLSAQPDRPAAGQAYRVEVRVEEAPGISISGSPFGTVEVEDERGALCSFELAAGDAGVGGCSLPAGPAGTRSLSLRYFGRGGFDYSETSASLQVLQPTTAQIRARQPSSTVVGQPYEVEVQVQADSGTPVGSVRVSEGSASCEAVLDGNGRMRCSLSSVQAGVRSLLASYLPSGDFAPSSASATQTVARAATAIAIRGLSPSPSLHAQSLRVDFAVSALAPSLATPQGSVSVTASPGGESCSASASIGSCSLNLFGAGERLLTARFLENADFAGASITGAHSVLRAPTQTRIESTEPATTVVGQPYAVFVRVSSGGVSAPGEVRVNDGTSQCTAVLGNGTGGCSLASLSAGQRTLQASYSGGVDFEPSAASGTKNVARAATDLRLRTLYPQPTAPDQALQVRWDLVPRAPGGGMPQGTVQVSVDSGETCSAEVGEGGCSLVIAAPGERSLQIVYAGSADHEGAQISASHRVDPDALFRSGFEAIEVDSR